jgi:hypothetical protein
MIPGGRRRPGVVGWRGQGPRSNLAHPELNARTDTLEPSVS